MRKIALKGGRAIVLREMTKNTIIPGGNGRCPVSCSMIVGGALQPTESFRILNELMIEKYGTTAIAAADRDRLIGFVNFYPTWCPHLRGRP